MELGVAAPGEVPQLVELLGILFTQEHELLFAIGPLVYRARSRGQDRS